MPNVVAYHRPQSIDEALALLNRPQATQVLGGGSQLVPSLVGDPTEVVDLQSLGLRSICAEGGRLVVGAMVTFADLAACEQLPLGARELAKREAPSTIRTLATVGGLIASADSDSELLAALLLLDGAVTVAASSGERTLALGSLLTTRVAPGEIIMHITVDPTKTIVSERTVRTGMDRAIVAVVGALGADGAVTLAATGMSGTPVVFDDPAKLVPLSDFRGSSAYRSQLATVLTARVRATITNASQLVIGPKGLS